MNELVKALEELALKHKVYVLSESTEAQIELSSDLGHALAMAQTLATQVTELHQVIAGNVEHSIATWLGKHADSLAEDYSNAHVPAGHIAWETVKIVKMLAYGVEQGAWRR